MTCCADATYVLWNREPLMTPPRAPRPCAEPGCPELVQGRRCKAHAQAQWRRYDEARGTAAQRGYTARWSRARGRFLAKHPFCGHCKAEDQVTVATEVDHIVPVDGADDPLFWDESNWQGLCGTHHRRKTAREQGAGPARAPRRSTGPQKWSFA